MQFYSDFQKTRPCSVDLCLVDLSVIRNKNPIKFILVKLTFFNSVLLWFQPYCSRAILLLLPSTGLDSKDRVCNVPELCALCTWTIYFKSKINQKKIITCTYIHNMYIGWLYVFKLRHGTLYGEYWLD
jgi:hypothetical protein